MGTPFRVRWDRNSIVITTGAGTERSAPLDEIARSWPLIESGATKTRLKLVTQNASYLESVFDDIGMPRAGAVPKAVVVGGDDASRIQLLHMANERDAALARVASFTGELDEMTVALESARGQVKEDEATIEELRAKVAPLAVQIQQLRSALDSSEAQIAKRDAVIEQLRTVGKDQTSSPLQATEIQKLRSNLHSTQRRFESDQMLIKELRGTIKTDRAASDAAMKDLHARVADLQSKLARDDAIRTIAELRAEVADLERMSTAQLAVALHVDGRKFVVENPIHPALLVGLREAAKLSMQYPGASIGESRKVLEAAIRMMWQACKGEQPPSDRVFDMLSGLRHDRLIPDDDWHLAKNIYSRASAFVHGKTARADIALWIYFGTVQFCELVPQDLVQGQPVSSTDRSRGE